MTFTIEVGKRGKDEVFSFNELEMFHQECEGGKIRLGSRSALIRSQQPTLSDIAGEVTIYEKKDLRTLTELVCSRCGRKAWMLSQSEAPSKVVKTAIDGEQRQIAGYIGEYVEKGASISGSAIDMLVASREDITVVQKGLRTSFLKKNSGDEG